MEVRINRKKYKVFAFDIETHNDNESIRNKKTSMWLGCLIDDTSKIDEESSYLYTMEQVFQKLEELSNPKRRHGEKKKPIKNIVVIKICAIFLNLNLDEKLDIITPIIHDIAIGIIGSNNNAANDTI